MLCFGCDSVGWSLSLWMRLIDKTGEKCKLVDTTRNTMNGLQCKNKIVHNTVGPATDEDTAV